MIKISDFKVNLPHVSIDKLFYDRWHEITSLYNVSTNPIENILIHS